MTKKSPCKGCVPPKRNETCHITCKEYLEYDEQHKKEKAVIDMKRNVRKDYDDHRVSSYRKAKKRKGKY